MTEPLPVYEDRTIYPLLVALADCLCAQLEQTPGGPPCYCGLLPGALTSMDFCDCGGSGCGQAWVRLSSVFPSVAFPQPSFVATNCATSLAVLVEMGVTRCVPGMDENGVPPDEATNSDSVRIQLADMMAMRRALVCCQQLGHKVMLGTYRPIGPSGNCGGGAWTATVPRWSEMAGKVRTSQASVDRLAQGVLSKYLFILGNRVLNQASTNCNVDTGRLRSSLTMAMTPEPSVRVGTDVEYARFVHEGTARHMIAAQPGKFLRFTGRGGEIVYVPWVVHPGYRGNPFLRNALQSVIARAAARGSRP